MAIGIVGNYGNNNQGDEAILEGILIQLKKVHNIDRQDIIVFSNQPEKTSEKYGVRSVKLYYTNKNKSAPLTMIRTILKNKSIIRDLDLLLIGGGGIFMDLYGREAFLFGMYGWLGKLSKTPVVLYGVGAGPILTRIGKVILRSLAHLSKIVTVRGPKSKELLRTIGVKSPIHVIGDPAFQVQEQIAVRKAKGLQIGVTAVPYYHSSYWPDEDKTKYENFIRGMAANLDNLLERYPDAQVNFFATKYPQDIMVTEEIQALMKHGGRCTICREELSHQQIVEFSNAQDLVIGTRLHSLILSLVTNVPIIAVAYHHKVQDFMDMINCSEYSIDIEQLNYQHDFFYKSYSKMEENWEATLIRFKSISEIMKEKALKGMELLSTVSEKKSKERVLVLSNMYPSHLSKTFGIFVKNQVEQLRDQGIQVDVIAIDDPRKGKVKLLVKYGKFFLKGIWNLLVRGRKYKAVHVHYIFPTGLLGLLYKKLCRTRLIVTSHGGDIDQMSKKSGAAQKYTRKILERSDHIITVGEALKEEVQRNFDVDEGKISVINMGVNREVFRQMDKQTMRKKLGFAEDERVLLFVGNLILAKGLDDLVEAFKLVSKEVPNASLHLIGEPKDQGYFETLKSRIQDVDGITIHNAKSQLEIAEWMSAADVFILPSHIEGFGLVALEAMSCGVPVVGTNIGGLRYLLAEERGVLVEARNPESLAKGIVNVLADEELQKRLVEKGFEKADEFDQEKLVASVIELYDA